MSLEEQVIENPFSGKKPDEMSPSYVAKYFVDTHTDFKKILEPGNSFINGARGTGKSMLLRSLEMTVAAERANLESIGGLEYVGIHVPLRKEDFGITELSSMIGFEGSSIGEHLLTMSITYHLIRNLIESKDKLDLTKVDTFAGNFIELYEICGGATSKLDCSLKPEDKLHSLQVVCERSSSQIRQHAKRASINNDTPAYNGALCGLRDFFLPLIEESKYIGYIPNKPFFIMLDDADNLPKSMQRIINSWISMRIYPKICLKVSTQLAYATYRTLDNRRIESPHDYNTIDVGSVYTNRADRYSQRVEEIVQKRLDLAGIAVSPRDFFPVNMKQRKRLEEIKEEIRLRFHQTRENPGRKGSTRASDEVTRYAVPQLMRELHGSKSSHTFSYAGYDSLVNLSSGIIRWFLEPAAQMFDEVTSASNSSIAEIPVSIQDRVIERWSKEFADELVLPECDDEFDIVANTEDASLHQIHSSDLLYKLHNLVSALGLFFRNRILDENASEQRAFSVVVRQDIPKQLQEVLSLGIRLGYLQRSDNSAKEINATRRPRYILARRLGPNFKLDISGYAAHLSVTAGQLEMAIQSPKSFVNLKTKPVNYFSNSNQFTLELDIDGN
ncbi:hypothetical protein ACJJI5_15010 [Microbulbifer sp. EKSA008]|uniref:ORC-CDC6 family AAA ATPase n=1 Tax=Microbulbifer sp. EKSA008 TaxID=3243367 RepID=UPI004042074F